MEEGKHTKYIFDVVCYDIRMNRSNRKLTIKEKWILTGVSVLAAISALAVASALRSLL